MAFCDVRGSSFSSRQRASNRSAAAPFPAINIEDSARTLTKRVAWRLPGQKEIIVPDMETKIAAHLAGVGIGFVPQPLCQTLIDKTNW